MRVAEHKRTAKLALKDKWGVAIGVFFLHLIIGSITNVIPTDYFWASIIVFIFLTGPLYAGYSWFYLDVKRLPNPKVETLFDSFSKDYIRVVLANLLVTIYAILWTLLLIIPGIIKIFSYSMTFYIMRDRKDLSAMDAITESRKMMDGHKRKLFLLMLSFIWWYIIPIIMTIAGFVMMAAAGGLYTLDPNLADVSLIFVGLGLVIIGLIVTFLISIYVTPYYMTAVAAFYDDYIKPKQGDYVVTEEQSFSEDSTLNT